MIESIVWFITGTIIVSLLLLTVFLIERFMQYTTMKKPFKHIKGYEQFIPPIVTQLVPEWMVPSGFINNPGQMFKPDTIIEWTRDKEQDYYKIMLGMLGFPFIVVTDPDIGKEIATKGTKLYKKNPSQKRTFVELFLGSNIFAEDDHQTWSHQRHLIDPGFTPQSLNLVANVTNNTMVEDMMPMISKDLEKRDVMSDFAKLTMDVIGKAGFSYSFDSFYSKPGEETLENKTNIFLANADFYRIVPTSFLRRTVKVGMMGKIHDSVDSFRKVISDIISKRERENDANQEEASDILSLLLKERRNNKEINSTGALSNDELISNAFVLLVAGHETTARTLGFALYSLCKNPQIQKELHDFVDNFTKVSGKDSFGYEDFQSGKLDYIKAIFKETLRLYPVAIGIVRQVTKTIDFKGLNIPKGTLCLYTWVTSMRSAKYWDKPDDFNPSRFLNESKEIINPQTNPFVYTPFGIGGRICIGKHFAEVEGVLALANLAKNFAFKLSDPNYQMHVDIRVTLRPVETLLVDFIPRN